MALGTSWRCCRIIRITIIRLNTWRLSSECRVYLLRHFFNNAGSREAVRLYGAWHGKVLSIPGAWQRSQGQRPNVISIPVIPCLAAALRLATPRCLPPLPIPLPRSNIASPARYSHAEHHLDSFSDSVPFLVHAQKADVQAKCIRKHSQLCARTECADAGCT